MRISIDRQVAYFERNLAYFISVAPLLFPSIPLIRRMIALANGQRYPRITRCTCFSKAQNRGTGMGERFQSRSAGSFAGDFKLARADGTRECLENLLVNPAGLCDAA